MSISVGDLAPDFTTKNQHGEDVTLSELRGSSVLVVFYPFAFSGICTNELCEIRDNLEDFKNSDVRVLAISCDPMFSLRAWSDQDGYEFDLLTDFWPHGDIARSYGVFNDQIGAATRGSFLIDAEGVVRWLVMNDLGDSRSLNDYREAFANVT